MRTLITTLTVLFCLMTLMLWGLPSPAPQGPHASITTGFKKRWEGRPKPFRFACTQGIPLAHI
jgi:hypothetical protein